MAISDTTGSDVFSLGLSSELWNSKYYRGTIKKMYRVTIGIVALGMTLSAFAVAKEPTFNQDIHPLLSSKCFDCHGPSKSGRKGRLRLDQPDGPEGALTQRDGYDIIKPGDPENSELWKRIVTTDADDIMPPPDAHKKPFTEEEKELIRQWILDGGTYQAFWSFIPPVKSELYDGSEKDWANNYIDAHVLEALEKEGLKPSPEADKRTLIRRVTFDLTGLPPTLEEIEAFLNDDGPDAYARLVEDLLARESYGEHMTRYWADLVRLGDTNGMHKDFPRDFTTYRDWIIRSFNDNKPYDDFITYQLAGDLYEDPTKEQLVASGFNRLHLIIDRGTALPEESLHKNVLDRVTAFGTVFMGMSVHCAQCHDHKADPLSQQEYYQLYAFFNNFAGEAETSNRPARGLQPPFISLTNAEQDERLAKLQEDITELSEKQNRFKQEQLASGTWPAELEETPVPWIWDASNTESTKVEFRGSLELDAVPETAYVRFVAKSNVKVRVNDVPLGRSYGVDDAILADVSSVLKAGSNSITAEAGGEAGFAFILNYVEGGEEKTFTSNTEWEAKGNKGETWTLASTVLDPNHEIAWTTSALSEDLAEIKRKINRIENKKKNIMDDAPGAMVMQEREPVRQANFLIRGAYDAPGDPVERNTPAFLPPMPVQEAMYSRMDLAEWLLDPEHPLTARVAVNRFWQQFFGIGIVETPDDFGAQGGRPSHPALLDDLAVHFMESGWDVKELVRTIVLSNTYRQVSDAAPEMFRDDPNNRLLARGPRYRMDAEMIRDQILAVSGQLNTTMYGPSVKPPQPPGLWEMVSMAEPKTYIADTDDNIYRRSLYTYWRRGMPPPQMTILNAPSREFCVALRERTNTPLQALLLMNEPEYLRAAFKGALRVLDEGTDTATALGRIYEKITSHEPSPERLAFMEETLEAFRGIYAEDEELTRALTAENAEWTREERVNVAAWTMLTHSLLNLELAKVKR